MPASRRRARGAGAAALLLAACASRPAPPPSQGYVSVPGGRVWYQVLGSGEGAPLLLLHGGPGARSCGFNVLRELGRDRPLVLYDQLGGGRSERPSDPSLWTTERFVEELAAVRKALGLSRVHLLGQSWGCTLAAEFLLTKKPAGVLSVTFASPLFSTERWLADARRLRSTLPPQVRAELERCERAGTPDDPGCKAANDEYLRRFVLGADRLDPVPECEGVPGANEEVYRRMWGPTEFTATGPLKDYDRTSRLGELRLPALFLAGRHDEAVPETVEEFRRLVPGARMHVFEKSAHAHFRTETAEFVRVVREFLAEVDSRTR